VFSLAGIAWACASIVIRLDWGWFWLPPAAIIVVRLTRGRSVRAVAFCIGALAPGITVSSYLLAQPAVDNWWHRQPFDAAGWRRSRESTDVFWPPRLRMVDDLLRRHDMHGWDRRKVIELLGEPDSTRWDRDNQIVYELGPERGFFGIDSEWLVITFTDDARVADYNLARD
jgi:hypothetical protein